MYFNGENLVRFEMDALLQDWAATSIQGMCGNFNDDPEDDVAQYRAELQGYPWQDRDCLPDMDHDPLLTLGHPERQDVLGDCKRFAQAFPACRHVVPIEPFVRNCWYAMSLCRELGRACDLCGVYDAYSRECARKGVVETWRNKQHCSKSQMS